MRVVQWGSSEWRSTALAQRNAISYTFCQREIPRAATFRRLLLTALRPTRRRVHSRLLCTPRLEVTLSLFSTRVQVPVAAPSVLPVAPWVIYGQRCSP